MIIDQSSVSGSITNTINTPSWPITSGTQAPFRFSTEVRRIIDYLRIANNKQKIIDSLENIDYNDDEYFAAVGASFLAISANPRSSNEFYNSLYLIDFYSNVIELNQKMHKIFVGAILGVLTRELIDKKYTYQLLEPITILMLSENK